MKLALRAMAGILLAGALPLACPIAAFADSKTTRPVTVTVTVPVMLQLAPSRALETVIAPSPFQAAAPERRTIALGGNPQAVTNKGVIVTQEWRRDNGRGVKVFTAVVP